MDTTSRRKTYKVNNEQTLIVELYFHMIYKEWYWRYRIVDTAQPTHYPAYCSTMLKSRPQPKRIINSYISTLWQQ